MAPTTCLVGKWNIMKVVISNTSNENCCQQFQYNLNHKTNPLDVNPSSFQNHRYFAWVKIELESIFLLFLQCWLFTFHKCQLGYLPKYIAYAARFVIPPPTPLFFFIYFSLILIDIGPHLQCLYFVEILIWITGIINMYLFFFTFVVK